MGKGLFRWLAWAVVLVMLCLTGSSLWHLKYMELFLLLLTLGCALLTVFFRIMRDKP